MSTQFSYSATSFGSTAQSALWQIQRVEFGNSAALVRKEHSYSADCIWFSIALHDYSEALNRDFATGHHFGMAFGARWQNISLYRGSCSLIQSFRLSNSKISWFFGAEIAFNVPDMLELKPNTANTAKMLC